MKKIDYKNRNVGLKPNLRAGKPIDFTEIILDIKQFKKIIKNMINNQKWYYIPVIFIFFILVAIVELTNLVSIFDYVPKTKKDSWKQITIRIFIYVVIMLLVFYWLNLNY